MGEIIDKQLNKDTLDKIKECIQKGAGPFIYTGILASDPVPLLFLSLDTMNISIIQYLLNTFNIDKKHSHSYHVFIDFKMIDEFRTHEYHILPLHDMYYNRTYYTELRRLHSLIFDTYEFEYDLYKFYMYRTYNVNTSVSLEEFANLKRSNIRWADLRFKNNKEYYSSIWKKVVRLLGFTEEEILSKRNENLLWRCECYYEYFTDSESDSDIDSPPV